MKKLILLVIVMSCFVFPASALDLEAPEVPDSARQFMPTSQESLGMGILEVLQDALMHFRPDLREASKVCTGIFASVMIVSLLKTLPGMAQKCADFAGTVLIAGFLMESAGSMVHMAASSVTEISEYGKLLLPILTSALAAQGGISASVALCATALGFITLLSKLIASILIPMVYVYIALAIAVSAIGEGILSKLQGFVKWLLTWCLKTVLYVFTGFISITGVVSGTADAAALKVTKLTISGFVPVVGGILSDASEAVLAGAATVKNTAGIYGMFAVLAICIGPFIRIGGHYLLLKFTAAVCSIFGSKASSALIGDFSAAMGILLAMTGSVSLMLLISTICFMKGVG